MNDSNQEQQVKILMRLLEGWRMAILPLKSVLIWEQQWHPAAIFGSVTFLHLFIWILDLNFLTTFAVVGFIVNLIDFLVPVICNAVYGANSWTGQKEKMFEEVCHSIVGVYGGIQQYARSFCSLRGSSPCMYYFISLSMLLVLAWLASSVNNILLLYVASSAALLLPGLQHRGIFNMISKSKLKKAQ